MSALGDDLPFNDRLSTIMNSGTTGLRSAAISYVTTVLRDWLSTRLSKPPPSVPKPTREYISKTDKKTCKKKKSSIGALQEEIYSWHGVPAWSPGVVSASTPASIGSRQWSAMWVVETKGRVSRLEAQENMGCLEWTSHRYDRLYLDGYDGLDLLDGYVRFIVDLLDLVTSAESLDFVTSIESLWASPF